MSSQTGTQLSILPAHELCCVEYLSCTSVSVEAMIMQLKLAIICEFNSWFMYTNNSEQYWMWLSDLKWHEHHWHNECVTTWLPKNGEWVTNLATREYRCSPCCTVSVVIRTLLHCYSSLQSPLPICCGVRDFNCISLAIELSSIDSQPCAYNCVLLTCNWLLLPSDWTCFSSLSSLWYGDLRSSCCLQFWCQHLPSLAPVVRLCFFLFFLRFCTLSYLPQMLLLVQRIIFTQYLSSNF